MNSLFIEGTTNISLWYQTWTIDYKDVFKMQGAQMAFQMAVNEFTIQDKLRVKTLERSLELILY